MIKNIVPTVLNTNTESPWCCVSGNEGPKVASGHAKFTIQKYRITQIVIKGIFQRNAWNWKPSLCGHSLHVLFFVLEAIIAQ